MIADSRFPASGFRLFPLLLAVLFILPAFATAQSRSAPMSDVARRSALDEGDRALSAGDANRAQTLATQHLERHPRDVRARVLLARVHISRDELDAAYVQLRRALQDAPRDVDVLYHLGLVAERLAKTELDRLFAMAPDSARVHQLMAESLEAQELRGEAEREYEAALKARPDLVDAMLGLARLQRLRLECGLAIALYTKAEALRPTFDSAYGLGVCYLRQQDDHAALKYLELAVARDPGAAVAWVDLASATLRAGRAGEAIAMLHKALALQPQMGEAYYMLGRAYQATGDRTRAQDAYATAERLRLGTARPQERH